MSNIYNKHITFPNGTLIGNWFEEDELKKKTGTSRTIPRQHFKRISFNLEKTLINNTPCDNTFKRVIGEKEPCKDYSLTSQKYGDHSFPESKYTHMPLRAEDQRQLFKKFVQKTIDLNKEVMQKGDATRSLTSTYRCVHVPQPFETHLGRRIMFTQEHLPIDDNKPDKLFMAQHQMSKYPNIISSKQVSNYIDKYVPYYKDKEITFWSTNLGKSNMYHTPTLGINPFAKSNSFSQPIQKTKGTTQYEGNVKNLSSSKNIYLNAHDYDYYETYKEEVEKKTHIPDLTPQIQARLLDNCSKKGWIGLRDLKIYLRSVAKNANCMIDRPNFKFYVNKYGIDFTDEELDFIFNKFDSNRNNHVNYLEVLNHLRFCSDNRKILIEKFKEQVKKPNSRFISFDYLIKLSDMNYHPEALKFIKSDVDVKHEYDIAWDNLKEDDFVTTDNLIEFFIDISSCIKDDDDFLQCLVACGFKKD